MYDSTNIARVVSNHAAVGMIFARLHFVASICGYVRWFCTLFALVSLMTLPKLAPVKEYETIELDFCSNPKQCSKAIVAEKNATTSQGSKGNP